MLFEFIAICTRYTEIAVESITLRFIHGRRTVGPGWLLIPPELHGYGNPVEPLS
jgi:hypothetical protein